MCSEIWVLTESPVPNNITLNCLLFVERHCWDAIANVKRDLLLKAACCKQKRHHHKTEEHSWYKPTSKRSNRWRRSYCRWMSRSSIIWASNRSIGERRTMDSWRRPYCYLVNIAVCVVCHGCVPHHNCGADRALALPAISDCYARTIRAALGTSQSTTQVRRNDDEWK